MWRDTWNLTHDNFPFIPDVFWRDSPFNHCYLYITHSLLLQMFSDAILLSIMACISTSQFSLYSRCFLTRFCFQSLGKFFCRISSSSSIWAIGLWKRRRAKTRFRLSHGLSIRGCVGSSVHNAFFPMSRKWARRVAMTTMRAETRQSYIQTCYYSLPLDKDKNRFVSPLSFLSQHHFH